VIFPLRDLLPSRTFPSVNTAIIVANCLVFLFELVLGTQLDPFVEQWGLVPMTIRVGTDPAQFVTVFTSMFLHGGWMHVIGNMWFLYIFGDNVEDAMGHVRYPVFYLLSGMGAAAAQILIDPTSKVPMIGASGAIAGVLGAYLSLYPRARIVSLLFLGIFIQFLTIPAYVVIIVWFLLQLVEGLVALGEVTQGGVAFWAHIGGFLVGFVLVRIFVRRDYRRPSEESAPSRIRRRFDWQ
jgi:membrane associated rhomboid family serine protease